MNELIIEILSNYLNNKSLYNLSLTNKYNNKNIKIDKRTYNFIKKLLKKNIIYSNDLICLNEIEKIFINKKNYISYNNNNLEMIYYNIIEYIKKCKILFTKDTIIIPNNNIIIFLNIILINENNYKYCNFIYK